MAKTQRVWKPLDVNGLRLYRVRVHFCADGRFPATEENHIVAAQSPRQAVALWQAVHGETEWIVEPDVTSEALNILQPADWDGTVWDAEIWAEFKRTRRAPGR